MVLTGQPQISLKKAPGYYGPLMISAPSLLSKKF